MHKSLSILPAVVVAVATLASAARAAGQPDRWYTPDDVQRGRDVFRNNCAGCHGARAEGAELGALKVPPLNGGGHSAHHGLDYLLEQITRGGATRGGQMPAFGTVLSEPQRLAAVAYLQSLWPEHVYQDWARMHPDGGHH